MGSDLDVGGGFVGVHQGVPAEHHEQLAVQDELALVDGHDHEGV